MGKQCFSDQILEGKTQLSFLVWLQTEVMEIAFSDWYSFF